MTILFLIIIAIIIIIIWRNRPIKNSHKLPQQINILEFDNPDNKKSLIGVQKGHKLMLSRERMKLGYHLTLTLETNNKDLNDLKMIIISWSEWKKRIFNFNYLSSDENVNIKGDTIKIDIGSFNNCPGSKNFLKRTAKSDILKVDLLNHIPEHNDFEYEKDMETQSVFCPCLSKKEINKFRKGRHYIDS